MRWDQNFFIDGFIKNSDITEAVIHIILVRVHDFGISTMLKEQRTFIYLSLCKMFRQ